jgi:transposase
MPQTIIGVDVAKDWIDTQEFGGGAARLAMEPKVLRRFARGAARAGALVVFEASGGYDRPLRAALEAAGAGFSRVNPGRAGQFARATGRLAKTDRVDARVLAEMGARLDLAPGTLLSPARRALQGLAARRRQLVEMRKQEVTRRQQIAEREVVCSIGRHVRLLDREVAGLDARIAGLVAVEQELAPVERRLRTAPGVGR